MKLFKVVNFFNRKKKQSKATPGVAGLWEDEKAFLKAVQTAHSKGRVFTTLTPFPVHGLEEAMEMPRSWIPWVTFFGGLTGFLFGLWFTWWTSAVSWPIIVGGKPFWSLPAFIPVIFELTILFAALSSIGALFYACGLPHRNPPIIDPDLTSHKFAIFIACLKEESLNELKGFLNELKPLEIVETEF